MRAELEWGVDFDASVPWVGVGLTGGALRIERTTNRWRGSGRISQLRSPVGTLTAAAAAGAIAWHEWSAGASFELRTLALEGTPSLWIPVLRLGCGGGLGRHLTACAVLQLAPPQRAAGCGAAGCEVELATGVRFGVQVEHTVGLGAAVRMGVVCGEGAVRWLGGFDANSHSMSMGFAWQWNRQRVVWGARTHPQLGWSHWWTCTFGSFLPAS